MNDASSSRIQLTYVFDAYCGWCFGFAPAFREFVAAHLDDIDLTVISGGLFTGGRVVPITSLGFLAGANQRISALTGAIFGQANARLAADPTFSMDSTAAARGFAALRSLAPERALEIAHAWQLAFYRDGQSLSSVDTVRATASALGLDPDAAAAAVVSSRSLQAAGADFRQARVLGVDSYPSVLVHVPGAEIGRLGSPLSTAAELGDGFARLLAGRTLQPVTQ